MKTHLVKPAHFMKVILKSNSHGIINLPKEVIEKIGWKVNENLILDIITGVRDDDSEWQFIEIEKEEDSNLKYNDKNYN
jgi:bifunctional DNA-binding transcriptional regulator/antitoxin component of YhaV-PrlF toxin-antitoxin module